MAELRIGSTYMSCVQLTCNARKIGKQLNQQEKCNQPLAVEVCGGCWHHAAYLCQVARSRSLQEAPRVSCTALRTQQFWAGRDAAGPPPWGPPGAAWNCVSR